MKILSLIAAIITVLVMITMLCNYLFKLSKPKVTFHNGINTGKCYISIKGEKRWVFISNGEITDNNHRQPTE